MAGKFEPRPLFGGWGDYHEWAQNSFISREAYLRQHPEEAGDEPDEPTGAGGHELAVSGPAEVAPESAGDEDGRRHRRAIGAVSQTAAEAAELAEVKGAIAKLAPYVPGWYLMYGAATRKIWAFPTSPQAPRGLVLAHEDPGYLYSLIQRAEAEFMAVRPVPR